MSLFGGLDKFGFSDEDIEELSKKPEKKAKTVEKQAKSVLPTEEKDLILDKTVTCPVCGMKVETKVLKTGRAKRKEPDFDLRPNFEGVDSLKYDVTMCPHCGYAAMNRFFGHLTTGQVKLIKENVSSKFKPVPMPKKEIYSYEDALDKYKLSLVSTMVKRAKGSEKAYTCLKIAWILRTMIAEIPESVDDPNLVQKRAELQEEYDGFYRKAYDGFQESISKEMPPYCGMETSTLEFMLANMAFYYKEYETASKLIANLLGSASTNARIKDKALDLKDQVLKAMKG